MRPLGDPSVRETQRERPGLIQRQEENGPIGQGMGQVVAALWDKGIASAARDLDLEPGRGKRRSELDRQAVAVDRIIAAPTKPLTPLRGRGLLRRELSLAATPLVPDASVHPTTPSSRDAVGQRRVAESRAAVGSRRGFVPTAEVVIDAHGSRGSRQHGRLPVPGFGARLKPGGLRECPPGYRFPNPRFFGVPVLWLRSLVRYSRATAILRKEIWT